MLSENAPWLHIMEDCNRTLRITHLETGAYDPALDP